MDGFTVTGGQLVAVLAVLLAVLLVAVAGRVLLTAAVIVGVQWVRVDVDAFVEHRVRAAQPFDRQSVVRVQPGSAHDCNNCLRCAASAGALNGTT